MVTWINGINESDIYEDLAVSFEDCDEETRLSVHKYN
jgi:hypothetical protein